MKNIINKNLITFLILFIFSFINFNYNFLNISGTDDFYNIPSTNGEVETTDGIIYGLLKDDFRLGRYTRDNYIAAKDPHKYKYYFSNKLEGKEFKYYVTAYGLQAKIFGFLVKKYNLDLEKMHMINSIIFSLIVASIFIFLQKNFSFLSSLIFVIAICTSPWVIAHGKDIRWITWSWYLPIWCVFFFNFYLDLKKLSSFFIVSIVLFFSILFRCLFGYEYISTILSITLLFYAYFILKNDFQLKKKIIYISSVGLFLLLGFVASFLFQNKIYHTNKDVNLNNFKSRILLNIGINNDKSLDKDPCLVLSFRKQNDDVERCKKIITKLKESSHISRFEVLLRYFMFRNFLPWFGNLENYMSEDFKNYLKSIIWDRKYNKLMDIGSNADLKGYLSIFSVIIQSFLFILLIFFSFKKVFKKGDSADKLLITGSFISSISWFVLAKQYSLVHIHLCFIAWYLAFVPVAYMLLVHNKVNGK